jgi:uncharacterized protein (DUF2141 family)
MKNITKLSLIAATLAVIGSSAALASDSQLENRLALQQRDAERVQKSTTIAVYAGRQGVSQRKSVEGDRSEVRFEWRTPARGQGYGSYVPAK